MKRLLLFFIIWIPCAHAMEQDPEAQPLITTSAEVEMVTLPTQQQPASEPAAAQPVAVAPQQVVVQRTAEEEPSTNPYCIESIHCTSFVAGCVGNPIGVVIAKAIISHCCSIS